LVSGYWRFTVLAVALSVAVAGLAFWYSALRFGVALVLGADGLARCPQIHFRLFWQGITAQRLAASVILAVPW
jgi:hypothetical protein